MKGSSFNRGVTLTEVVIGVVLFTLISTIAYRGYTNLYELIAVSRDKVTAASVANELFEVVRNMPYADIGIEDGIPSGVLPRSQELVRNGKTFYATTTVRNIDDPFDGTIGGSPNDLSPADSKLVDILVGCPSCTHFDPVHFTSRIGPKNLETASENGALFIQVIDVNGQPVVDADVYIENADVDPVVSIEETTDNNGMLQLVDVPPDVQGYEITISKSGYSTSKTYSIDELSPSTPLQPNVTVVLQQVTGTTFIISEASDVNVSTVTQTCQSVGGIDFTLTGSHLIGINPDVVKYDVNHQTDGSGLLVLNDLESDTYSLDVTDGFYQLEGSSPATLLDVAPNEDYDVMLVVGPDDPATLLVTVRDGITLQPLSEARVTLERETGETIDEVTGRGYLHQTDWSGGSGQILFEDETEYYSSDGDVDTSGGELRLREVLGEYVSDGELVSSIFDTGEMSNYEKLSWTPQDQGIDEIRFQFATSNSTSTESFIFKGPDGATTTYYTLAETDIPAVHNGDRYARYKAYLHTDDVSVTPNISDVSFTFTTDCVPPGQAVFSGLPHEEYQLTVEADGYQSQTVMVGLDTDWKRKEIILNES